MMTPELETTSQVTDEKQEEIPIETPDSESSKEPKLKRKRSSRKKRRSIKNKPETKEKDAQENEKKDDKDAVESKEVEAAIFELNNEDVDRIVGPCPNCIII